ncbi:hypothetical protein Tco_0067241 [Tanacetum coccineum]
MPNYDKISYDKAYNDMQHKIERLQAQLGDQKGNSQDTPCVSNTLDPLFQKLEDENDYPFQPSREEKYVPTKLERALGQIQSPFQTHVVTKKDVNSDSNGLSSTGSDNTAKTRRPQPRSNTQECRVRSVSKSSCNKKKKFEVEKHHRNLLLVL